MSKMNWLKQIVFTGMALVGSLVAQTAPKQGIGRAHV